MFFAHANSPPVIIGRMALPGSAKYWGGGMGDGVV
jgi:hypothetical protein